MSRQARQLASLVLRRFDPAAPMAEAAYLAALDKVTGGAATTLRDNESLALCAAARRRPPPLRRRTARPSSELRRPVAGCERWPPPPAT